MLTLSRRHQTTVGLLLVILMAATRSHHFPTIQNILPDASWAVFFLAGVYLRPAWVLAALLGLSAFLDFAAINWIGISDFCVSPAYVALVPAYAALWFAGHWYAGRYSFKPATLLLLTGSAFIGTAICELISSGSFYFFSGRFPETTMIEFGSRLVKYAPHGILSMAFWVGFAALAHTLVVVLRNQAARPKLT